MVDDEELRRPDPDALLAQVCEKPRGKLKVFFGACAGVGKPTPCYKKRSVYAPKGSMY